MCVTDWYTANLILINLSRPVLRPIQLPIQWVGLPWVNSRGWSSVGVWRWPLTPMQRSRMSISYIFFPPCRLHGSSGTTLNGMDKNKVKSFRNGVKLSNLWSATICKLQWRHLSSPLGTLTKHESSSWQRGQVGTQCLVSSGDCWSQEGSVGRSVQLRHVCV
jgi:hypothetical protein